MNLGVQQEYPGLRDGEISSGMDAVAEGGRKESLSKHQVFSLGVERTIASENNSGPVGSVLSQDTLKKCFGETTIMAVTYDGGVIMGADSRTSTGTYVANRVSDKITALHDFIYACRSGSAADTQAVSDYVRYFLASHSAELGRLPSVKTAASLVSGLCYQNKDKLLAGMIIAGWDPVEGGSVYEIPLGGTVIKQKFAIGGSGSTYIYGHVDSSFKENMTKEEAQQFVRKAISHAMARDGSSGGVIRMVVIDKTGVSREYIPGDKLPFGP